MKTLALSADDIQQFTKLIYDQQKTAASIAAVTQMEQNAHVVNGSSILNPAYNNNSALQQQQQQQQPQQQQSQQQLPGAHIMSLQYYLKHPSIATVAATATATNATTSGGIAVSNDNVNYPTTVIQSHQQQQQHNQQQLHHQQQQQQQHSHHLQHQHQPHHPSNLRLKQSSSGAGGVHHHHQLPNGYHSHHHQHQHHPYYGNSGVSNTQHSSSTTAAHLLTLPHGIPAAATTAAAAAAAMAAKVSSTTNTSHNRQHQQNSVPVHALNQNSNFSAASSSTGGGTNSSHAPTQQSNTTGPSLSPPAAVSANPRTQSATAKSSTTSAANAAAVVTPPQRYTIVNAVANSVAGSCNGGSAKKLKTEPVLSPFYQTERLSFANAHLTWSQIHWRRLLLQDERKFNLDGPDGYSNYYHDLRNYERTLSQRPRGISVYVYLLVTVAGPIHLEVSTSKVGAESIIDTLLRQRANIITKLGGNSDFLLQDHNWTTNALPTAQEMLNAEGIKTQKWPTIAHDMNIMENVWGWMIREVYDGGRKFSRKDDLIFRIREAWARLPVDLIRNLYSTLPERVSELYLTRGAYTNC